MRILHTADWHLGKKLDNFLRIDEQKAVLTEIITIAEEQNVDLVIVAGDLFDNGNPGNDASELLYKTLKRLARNATVPVIAIAGNHDSPSRVNVADVLARENGIIFIGYPTDEVPVFNLENSFSVVRSAVGFIELNLPKFDYPVRILHTAYANEMRLKECFSENKQLSLQETLAAKWMLLCNEYCLDNGVNLLTTHLYMAKRGSVLEDEPDGERPLMIGNADVVYSDTIPSEIQYVALGHLHRYHDVGSNQPAIYSGSPLAYSFSEAGQQKYVSIIDIEPNKVPEIQQIKLESGRQLVRKSFETVDDAVFWLEQNPNTLVELTLVIDEYLKSDDRKHILQSHDGIIHLIPKVKNDKILINSQKQINLNQDMEQLFVDYFKSKNSGQSPNDEILALFKEIQNQ